MKFKVTLEKKIHLTGTAIIEAKSQRAAEEIAEQIEFGIDTIPGSYEDEWVDGEWVSWNNHTVSVDLQDVDRVKPKKAKKRSRGKGKRGKAS